MAVVQTPDAHNVRFSESCSLTFNSAGPLGKSPWPMRTHTPYTNTPRSRRIGGKSEQLPKTPPSEEQVSNWKQLTGKTWHTYYVTPMYNFSYDPKLLKKYSHHLSAYLKAERNKGLGVDIGEDLNEHVRFCILKGLAISAGDPEAVEITVTAKNERKGGSTHIVFTALLVSVDADVDEIENFTILPLLLVKGPVSITRMLIACLQNQFDCVIKPLKFCPMELAGMVTMWTGFVEEGTKKPVELSYTVPKEIEGLQRITITIEAEDAKALWDSIHEEGSSEVTSEEVEAFIKSLERHFYRHFRVHLDGMSLTRISTPDILIGQENRLKIVSETRVVHILGYLTELALMNSII